MEEGRRRLAVKNLEKNSHVFEAVSVYIVR
jgi:hypothetical protein